MKKDRLIRMMKRALVQLLGIIICLAVSFGIAYLIHYFSDTSLRRVMVYEGFLIIMAGVLLSPRGNRSIINVNALDQPNAAQIAYRDLEVNRMEQEIERQDTSYYKNFFSSMKAGANNLTFIVTGTIMQIIAMNYLS
ncbi:MAG: hypothetical protein K0R46_3118 [Herbinix sp.]|jgi:hypothetical protein|nr:hypothetical protein [Herbinix sp.]